MSSPVDRRSALALLGVSALSAACDVAPAAPRVAPESTAPAQRAPSPSSPPALSVEVWHDTVCPWCRIGLHNLGVALDGLRDRGVAAVYRPFLLEPDAPPGGEDLRERLGRRYGAERLAGMFSNVSQAGARYGVRFDWERVRTAPQTAPSHALIEFAPEGRKRAVLDALHLAYFEQGRDIGDAGVLASIASELRLSESSAREAVTNAEVLASIRRRAAEAAARGIAGVPHFVIGGRTLHGAQGPDELRGAIEAALRA